MREPPVNPRAPPEGNTALLPPKIGHDRLQFLAADPAEFCATNGNPAAPRSSVPSARDAPSRTHGGGAGAAPPRPRTPSVAPAVACCRNPHPMGRQKPFRPRPGRRANDPTGPSHFFADPHPKHTHALVQPTAQPISSPHPLPGTRSHAARLPVGWRGGTTGRRRPERRGPRRRALLWVVRGRCVGERRGPPAPPRASWKHGAGWTGPPTVPRRGPR